MIFVFIFFSALGNPRILETVACDFSWHAVTRICAYERFNKFVADTFKTCTKSLSYLYKSGTAGRYNKNFY